MDMYTGWNMAFLVMITTVFFYGIYKLSRYAFIICMVMIMGLLWYGFKQELFANMVLWVGCPLLIINTTLYVFLHRSDQPLHISKKYQVHFGTNGPSFKVDNIKRGISIIGSAGSGKTESVVYGFLKHLAKENFSGVIHDYKDFELTEMAYPLFKNSKLPFYVVSFDQIIHQVNPVAPRYLENEQSVYEVSRVLIENLLEQKESGSSGTSKFFSDAAEGLMAGLIWKLKSTYPEFCTLPHLIATYQLLDTDSLMAFLETDSTSRVMASAFISGKDSDRQTA